MSKHTPGPWHVEDSRTRSLLVANKEFIMAQVLFAQLEPDEVDKANARLMAAAPEMAMSVVKLRAALGALRPFPLVVEPVAAALIAEADAALAKAGISLMDG